MRILACLLALILHHAALASEVRFPGQGGGIDLVCADGEPIEFLGGDPICGTDGTGGGAGVLDLGDNGVNESSAIAEIATSGDTFGVFSEPAGDKLLVNLAQPWPSSNSVVNTTGCVRSNATDRMYEDFDCDGVFDKGTDRHMPATVIDWDPAAGGGDSAGLREALYRCSTTGGCVIQARPNTEYTIGDETLFHADGGIANVCDCVDDDDCENGSDSTDECNDIYINGAPGATFGFSGNVGETTGNWPVGIQFRNVTRGGITNLTYTIHDTCNTTGCGASCDSNGCSAYMILLSDNADHIRIEGNDCRNSITNDGGDTDRWHSWRCVHLGGSTAESEPKQARVVNNHMDSSSISVVYKAAGLGGDSHDAPLIAYNNFTSLNRPNGNAPIKGHHIAGLGMAARIIGNECDMRNSFTAGAPKMTCIDLSSALTGSLDAAERTSGLVVTGNTIRGLNRLTAGIRIDPGTFGFLIEGNYLQAGECSSGAAFNSCWEDVDCPGSQTCEPAESYGITLANNQGDGVTGTQGHKIRGNIFGVGSGGDGGWVDLSPTGLAPINFFDGDTSPTDADDGADNDISGNTFFLSDVTDDGFAACNDGGACSAPDEPAIEAQKAKNNIYGNVVVGANRGLVVYDSGILLNTEPENDNALTQILARDATTGQVKYRTAASIVSSGDIGSVFTCLSGDCADLVADTAQTFDMTAGGASKPVPMTTTLPGTCSEGQQYHDQNAGGPDVHVCTASNTWHALVGVPSATTSTDNAITRWDSTTGRLLQNSGVTVSDTGVMDFPSTGAINIPANSTAGQSMLIREDSDLGTDTWAIDLAAVNLSAPFSISPQTSGRLLGTSLLHFAASDRVQCRDTAAAGAAEECSASNVIDMISGASTQGSVLYRGAAGWSALAPGTANHVLHTQGAGADPIWAADDGAGGGSNVTVDGGSTIAGPDLRSEGEIDFIECTGAAAPDASCAADDDILARFVTGGLTAAELRTALADGDETGTGDAVFQDSPVFTTAITIPQGTGPTANDPGEIAHDTTANQLVMDDFVFHPVHTECAVIENLAAADDSFEFYMAAQAVTVTSVGCRCRGTCSGLATFSLEDRGGNAMTITGTNPTCATTGNATFAAVTAGNGLVAGEGIAFDVGTVTPETDEYTICVTYTVDRQ